MSKRLRRGELSRIYRSYHAFKHSNFAFSSDLGATNTLYSFVFVQSTKLFGQNVQMYKKLLDFYKCDGYNDIVVIINRQK